jgi:glyoxylase-like metal-dependent hydrolase (beta-lactamase superfamily II)
MKTEKSFVWALLTLLLVMCLFGFPAGADSDNEDTGSFVKENGYTYYIKNDVKITGEYVKDKNDDIWYFNSEGKGVITRYVYLADNLVQIFDWGYNSCFLLIGTEKALWIDSGFGYGNLIKLTKLFTNKPIEGVVLTHYHIDHVGGSFLFDKVYLNEKDWPVNTGQEFASREARYNDEISTFRAHAEYQEFYTLDDYVDNIDMTDKLVPLNDGDVIDVGGASVEAIWTPGHSMGMTMILFREHKILMTGDECNHNTLMSLLSVTAYKKVIQNLIARNATRHEWTKIYISHGDGHSDAPETLLQDMVNICDGILGGSIIGVPYFNPTMRRAYAVGPDQLRLDGGFANLVWNPRQTYDPF